MLLLLLVCADQTGSNSVKVRNDGASTQKG